MSIRDGKAIYHYFLKKEGSNHIAKPVTLAYMVDFAKKENPKHILEFGSGIGTISYALLENSNVHIDMYEGNKWCIEQLEKNLQDYKDRITIITSLGTPPQREEYGLIIVDGGGSGRDDFGSDDAVLSIIKKVKNIKNLYFEGRRKEQQVEVFKFLKDTYTFKMTFHKPMFYKGEKLTGGRSYTLTKSNIKPLREFKYYYWLYFHMSENAVRIRRKIAKTFTSEFSHKE